MPVAAIAAVGIGSAVVGGIGAAKAAGAMKNAANKANAAQQAYDARNRADLAPYRSVGSSAADKYAWLMGLPSASGDVSGIKTQLSGVSPAEALQMAQTMGDSRVSSSREMTQDWIAKGIPFEVVNGIAVRTDGNSTNGAYGGDGFGSLLQPFEGKDLVNDPGYKFGLDQGNQAIRRAAAARGASFTGGTLKALDKFGTDYAGTKFNEAFNRNQTNKQFTANTLMGLIGVGSHATDVGVGATQNTANAVNSNDLQAGQAAAAGDIGIANAINGGMKSALDVYLATQGQGSSMPGVTPSQINAADYGAGTASSKGAGILANLPNLYPTPAVTDQVAQFDPYLSHATLN